jgi:predicted transposase YbfD/YdcC
MSTSPALLFLGYFDAVHDPRVDRTTLHPLPEILAVAIGAMICGADTWDDIEEFGNAKTDWFRTFLTLKHGIPSHDTFNRVLTRLCPNQFQSCFLKWIQSVATITDGQVVAIDGKKLRHSADPCDGSAAMHMVSAWASENRLILGQVKVDEKSNEITAIPALLRAIEIAGCIVTIDAMGSQREIAATIIEAEADYLLAVKENQPTVHAAIAQTFAAKLAQEQPPADLQSWQTRDHGHGRDEVRTTYTTEDLQALHMSDRLMRC